MIYYENMLNYKIKFIKLSEIVKIGKIINLR